MKKKIVIANWKMNKNHKESVSFLKKLTRRKIDYSKIKVIICPSFVSLVEFYKIIKNNPIRLGAQNIHYKEKGAYTGEVSVSMIYPFCSYVILGHSERRIYFQEDYYQVNEKIKLALKFKIKPILCLGENLLERKENKTFKVIDKQLKMALKSLTTNEIKNIIFAYEPIWAIGTGKNDKPEDTKLISNQIRRLLINKFFIKKDEIKIIYGGSANLSNIEEFLMKADIDGFLIGKASLDFNNFIKIIKLIEKINY